MTSHGPTGYPQRKVPRLKEYDYGQPGYYFVTICAAGKKHLFGEVAAGQMERTTVGVIAAEEVEQIGRHRENVRIEKWVVMPNHIHMIVRITGRDMTCHVRPALDRFSHPEKGALPMVIGAYKAAVTRRVRAAMTSHGPTALWQGRYFEHVIRNEQEYLQIVRYIDENPLKWELDEYHI